jgi:hypothetical protein
MQSNAFCKSKNIPPQIFLFKVSTISLSQNQLFRLVNFTEIQIVQVL